MVPRPPTAFSPKGSSKVPTSSTASPSKWIRIEKPFPLPDYVRAAIERLTGEGFVAYVVGGCVRDFLLGLPVKDHDISTSASPEDLCRIFPNAITVGKAFGVLKVPIDHPTKPVILEIATFREDLEYEDHRHPVAVRFTGPEEDARRRDFTVNGLFFDPKTSRILDTVGGMEDLSAKVIRAIGDPSARFKEDALRLLRAVRFTHRLGFTLDPATADAVRLRGKLITKVSAERVRDEIGGMLTGPGASQSLRSLAELGLLPHVLPEVERMRTVGGGAAFRQTLKILELLNRVAPAPRSWELGFAALLQSIGKPDAWVKSAGKNVNGHEIEGARMAAIVCDRLRLPKSESDSVARMVEELPKFREAFDMREATLMRFVRQPGFEHLLKLHEAEALATDGNLAYGEFCASRYREFADARARGVADPKLLKGEDLIQLGLRPGPRFAEILRTVEDLALEGKLKTQEEALEYVVKYFVG